jgi:hypothetical protein
VALAAVADDGHLLVVDERRVGLVVNVHRAREWLRRR